MNKTLALSVLFLNAFVWSYAPASAFFKPSPERILSMLDADKSGNVTKSEMTEFIVNKRGGEQSDADLMFSCLDKNTDEVLDLEELGSLMDTRKSVQETGSC